jgi:hypothetical protein
MGANAKPIRPSSNRVAVLVGRSKCLELTEVRDAVHTLTD